MREGGGGSRWWGWLRPGCYDRLGLGQAGTEGTRVPETVAPGETGSGFSALALGWSRIPAEKGQAEAWMRRGALSRAVRVEGPLPQRLFWPPQQLSLSHLDFPPSFPPLIPPLPRPCMYTPCPPLSLSLTASCSRLYVPRGQGLCVCASG